MRLGELFKYGMGIRFSCHACGHSAIREPLPLSIAMGEDFPVAEVRGRCNVCQSTEVATTPANAD